MVSTMVTVEDGEEGVFTAAVAPYQLHEIVCIQSVVLRHVSSALKKAHVECKG